MKTNTSLSRFVGGISLLALTLVASAAPTTKSGFKTWAPAFKTSTAKTVAKTHAAKTTRTRSTEQASVVATSHKRHFARMMHHASTHLAPVKANATLVKG